MKQFVIEETHTWKRKDGTEATMKSYFKEFTTFVYPLIHLANIDECKKYGTRAEALIDWRKYFRHKKTSKIVQINSNN